MGGGEKVSEKQEPGRRTIKDWLWRLGLSAVGGVGISLAFPKFDLAPLAWVTLVPILWSVRKTSGRKHLLIGWWAGTITNAVGFYWIGGMLMDFGHMSFVPAAALTLLMAVYQGVVFALWLWLLQFLRRRCSFGMWLLAPVSYVSAEILVPFIFPWFFGNSQYWVLPFVQVCELGGVTLLSFFLVMTNGLLVDFLERWRDSKPGVFRPLVGAAVVPLFVGVYGTIRVAMVDAQAEASAHMTIGLVEADVGIWEKEDPQKIKDNLVRHQRMSVELERRGAELIVWPETAYHAPFTYARRAGKDQLERFRPLPRDVAFVSQSDLLPPEHAQDDIQAGTPEHDRFAPQRGFKTPLLFGALTARSNPENRSPRHPGVDYLNTAILLDRAGKVLGAYDKVYLLIFGEYIPFGHVFPAFYRWLPEAGDLTRGESVEVLPLGDYRIGVMICYEDILPAFTRAIADKNPHILINITNDAWFGKTSEPYLHLALSVFRAIENRVPLVRSTNTGVSCFVDPAGRIVSQTQVLAQETLLARMPMMQGGTPYQVLADWPAYLSVLSVLLISLIGRYRRKK